MTLQEHINEQISRLTELNSNHYQFEKVSTHIYYKEIDLELTFNDEENERLPRFTISLNVDLTRSFYDTLQFKLNQHWLDLPFILQEYQFEIYKNVVQNEKLKNIVQYLIDLVETAKSLEKYDILED